jgi:tRNA (cmo5U34)-methyltransferase
MTPKEWTSSERALAYLARADSIPHRAEGEGVLLDIVSPETRRVLDIGTGDGRLLALVLLKCPGAEGVALDFSPSMLQAAGQRFAGDDRVSIVTHDFERPLPDLGRFDLVVSSFAIHHCSDERKRSLYAEILELLLPGGIFANLEHVSSPTPALHLQFLEAIGMTVEDEDASNQLLDVETQLRWLREIGYTDVDCHWKWREFALMGARRDVSRQ